MSKEIEELPLEMESPELGVTVTVTVADDPPVFENVRPRFVLEPLARVELVGTVVALTPITPGVLTVRVAFEVWVVTLVPLAETVIV